MRHKEIQLSTFELEAKVAEMEISLLWDFHLHSLSSADGGRIQLILHMDTFCMNLFIRSELELS